MDTAGAKDLIFQLLPDTHITASIFSAGGGALKGRRGKQPRYALGTRANGCPSEQNVGMDKKVGVLTIILLFLYPVVLKAFDCD